MIIKKSMGIRWPKLTEGSFSIRTRHTCRRISWAAGGTMKSPRSVNLKPNPEKSKVSLVMIKLTLMHGDRRIQPPTRFKPVLRLLNSSTHPQMTVRSFLFSLLSEMLTLDLAAQSWHQQVHLRSFSLTFQSILF